MQVAHPPLPRRQADILVGQLTLRTGAPVVAVLSVRGEIEHPSLDPYDTEDDVLWEQRGLRFEFFRNWSSSSGFTRSQERMAAAVKGEPDSDEHPTKLSRRMRLWRDSVARTVSLLAEDRRNESGRNQS